MTDLTPKSSASRFRFRAWDKEKGKHGKFVRDFVLAQEDGYLIAYSNDAEMRELILMQSTGLLDKNGKEIYEGDIVMYANDFDGSIYPPEAPEPHNDFAVVEWNAVHSWFSTDARGEGNREHGTMSIAQRIDEYGDFEIIGNLYTTPQLLK